MQMVGFPTDKQPAGSAWWDECAGTSADFDSSATASHQVGECTVCSLQYRNDHCAVCKSAQLVLQLDLQ